MTSLFVLSTLGTVDNLTCWAANGKFVSSLGLCQTFQALLSFGQCFIQLAAAVICPWALTKSLRGCLMLWTVHTKIEASVRLCSTGFGMSDYDLSKGGRVWYFHLIFHLNSILTDSTAYPIKQFKMWMGAGLNCCIYITFWKCTGRNVNTLLLYVCADVSYILRMCVKANIKPFCALFLHLAICYLLPVWDGYQYTDESQ